MTGCIVPAVALTDPAHRSERQQDAMGSRHDSDHLRWPSRARPTSPTTVALMALTGPAHRSESPLARPLAGSPPEWQWLPDPTDSDDTLTSEAGSAGPRQARRIQATELLPADGPHPTGNRRQPITWSGRAPAIPSQAYRCYVKFVERDYRASLCSRRAYKRADYRLLAWYPLCPGLHCRSYPQV